MIYRCCTAVLLAILLFSCKTEEREQTAPEPQEIVETDSVTSERSGSKFIERADLAYKWAESLEDLTKTADFFQIEKETMENRHVPGKIDTIKTFNFRNSELEIHSTEGLYALRSATIQDQEIALSENVRVGMEIRNLEDLLSAKIDVDTLKIGNQEQTNLFSFIFENEKLEQVDYQGYVD